jgi:hypothetical protein
MWWSVDQKLDEKRLTIFFVSMQNVEILQV